VSESNKGAGKKHNRQVDGAVVRYTVSCGTFFACNPLADTRQVHPNHHVMSLTKEEQSQAHEEAMKSDTEWTNMPDVAIP